jgi:hypothetical protein
MQAYLDTYMRVERPCELIKSSMDVVSESPRATGKRIGFGPFARKNIARCRKKTTSTKSEVDTVE